jgi:transposase-like protein
VKNTEASTSPGPLHVPSFEGLEEYIREQVQRLVQRLLDQEATEVLGRQKYERAETTQDSEEAPPYRNGHGDLTP